MTSIINSTLKPFKTTAYHNGEFVQVTDADLKGQWSVFFFYPADFTFVCPTELGDVADLYKEFQKIGVEIYSVSTDTHFTHKAWHDASDTIKKIEYPMLGDPTHAISRNFGVLIEDEGLALRGTFVVNPEGVIKVAEINDLGIGRDAKELLRKVQAAQYVAAHPGEVCPASGRRARRRWPRRSTWSARSDPRPARTARCGRSGRGALSGARLDMPTRAPLQAKTPPPLCSTTTSSNSCRPTSAA